MADKPRILVIGDAMLDTYIYGEVSRVSPEAPIPVVCPNRREDRPGGAANVACNVAALGAQVTVLFLTGRDSQAEQLKNKLCSFSVNADSFLQETGQSTINKVRLVGNGQQIARIDLNDRYLLDNGMENEILKRFQEVISEQDIVILSDYGKGTCTERICRAVICLCREQGKPVIVDPKGMNWDKYRGAFAITPNMKELNQYCGQLVPNEDRAIEKAYQGICGKLGTQYLLLTRSERGMSLISANDILHIPTQAQEVKDVSGAGDTVVAALAVRLGRCSADVEGAVRYANAAAGVAVGKLGTVVVTREEVLLRISEEEKDQVNPCVFTSHDMEKLEKTLRCWRAKGEVIVTTNGCFDVLHIGHLKVLQEAKRQGDRLVVAINADAAVRRLKGPRRPVNGERARADMLLSLRMVNAVVIFDPQDEIDTLTMDEKAKLSPKALAAAPEAPMALMRHIRPDVHVKGGDYTPADVPEAIYAKQLVLVPFVEGYSTTGTLERMEGSV